MKLTLEEEKLINQKRWEKEVRSAQIKHESHSFTQTGNCCDILLIQRLV